jgi:glycosyltransferase involved in cell wall biosynthesis
VVSSREEETKSTMAKSVTVAICTWNRAKLLDQTLSHLCALRIPERVDWELIIVNNDCTDDTDKVVGQYADRLPIVLCHEPRPGLSSARNHAIAHARGDFVLWTDDDVLVDPDWMTKLLEAFDDHQAAFVFGKVQPWWETAPPSWYSPDFDGMFALLDYGSAPFLVAERRHQPFGVNMAMRREVFQEVGRFQDEVSVSKKCSCEDVEYFYRVMDRGLRAAYTPHALIRHFIPRQRCTKKFYRSRAWHGSISHLYLLQKESNGLPRLAGLPRYYYRISFDHLGRYLGALWRGNESDAFFYELKMIRFIGLLREALRQGGKRKRAIPAEGAA